VERRKGERSALIKAVLFDLDGTLYDRDALAARLFDAQYREFERELSSVGRERFLRDVHLMDEHGHGDKETGYSNLVRAWGLDARLATRLIDQFWSSYDGLCALPEDTRSTVAELRRRDLKLGVGTNGQGLRQRRKLAALGLERAFDVVLVSEEEGVRKPDAEIFRRALARCGVAASEALFVGDHPDADVRGAHDAGLTAVWKFVPYWPPVVPGAVVVRNLAELLLLV
jgi:putative hydrolase of the HAD superfamily